LLTGVKWLDFFDDLLTATENQLPLEGKGGDGDVIDKRNANTDNQEVMKVAANAAAKVGAEARSRADVVAKVETEAGTESESEMTADKSEVTLRREYRLDGTHAHPAYVRLIERALNSTA
jgi:hypothetical protein